MLSLAERRSRIDVGGFGCGVLVPSFFAGARRAGDGIRFNDANSAANALPILPRPPWLRRSLLWGQPLMGTAPAEADHEVFKILDAHIRLMENIGLMGEGIKKSGCTD